MSARRVTECELCGGDDLKLVLDLGASPATCHMGPVGERPATEEHHPLELLECQDCGLVVLGVIVDRRELFPEDYPYSSGNSKALHENFEDLARSCDPGPEGLVVDIGANDGTLLSKFDCEVIGVEPTNQADKIGGHAYDEFFTEDLAREILDEHGPANVVTAGNVLAHVDDIHDVMRGIRVLLAEDGLLVAENHDLLSVADGQWDTVYHEHLRFFDPATFALLLDRHGLEHTGWESIPTHGGSFRMTAKSAPSGLGMKPKRRTYDFARLARQATETRQRLRALPTPLIGIGATARATTVINYCGLDAEDIECVCEVAGSDKIGRYIPGTRIPVVDEEALFASDNDALLFSWHLAESIVPKLRERGYQGHIHVPMEAA